MILTTNIKPKFIFIMILSFIGLLGCSSQANNEATPSEQLVTNKQIETQINTYEEKVNRLQKQINELSKDSGNLKGLQTKVSEKDKQYKQLKSNSKVYIGAIDKLNSQLRSLSLELKSLETNNAHLIASRKSETQRLSNSIEKLKLELKEFKELYDTSSKNFSDLNNKIAKLKTLVSKNQSVIANQKTLSNEALNQRTIFLVSALIVFLLIIIWLVKRSFASDKLSKEDTASIRSKFEEECNSIDLKLAELLENQINSDAKCDVTEEVNHSLPLKVATEIHRIRKRLEKISSETKGIKPLGKSIDRIEENLNEKGYEIIDLLGQNYVDGMTANQEYVLDEELSPGERVISKVVKPQINYNDVIIQVSDIIVSFGE